MECTTVYKIYYPPANVRYEADIHQAILIQRENPALPEGRVFQLSIETEGQAGWE